jgi:O-methyltransferase/methyltransferase family protein
MQEKDHRAAMNRLIGAYRQSRCVGVAAELQIPERLAAGARTSAELAAECGANEHSLRRLLRALVAMDVLVEAPSEHFGLTPLGEQLRADKLGPAARLFNSEFHLRSWDHLDYSVKTGDIAFDHVYGMHDWDFYATHPEEGALFDAAMSANTGPVITAIADAYDFSRFPTLADIGGGNATLLEEILRRFPHNRAVLFDLPSVVERAKARQRDAGVANRIEFVGGSFLESVPSGADAYLMKSIIHDWDDAHATKIIERCRNAVEAGAHLLLIERVMPEHVEPRHLEGLLMDLNMMVNNGGLERTEAEFRILLQRGGFRLERMVQTETVFCVLESVAF